ncbi:uncharacterized protein LOC128254103 [Drosophila gunungcola]|uniref:Neural proliferation differentiation and control protein 1 n=1 Tax=Drosophila gunungcola TaxID=103775 RepID=A0A9P9YN75_9MUSC|nr:uncharacterized protein LOC128254103 [Drosophila gunungcola]KAI8039810.1 hypothetical protein M5D96_007234 [Drosophila gunungcola]
MAARLELTVSFALAATVLCCILGHCEMSVYPGLRRRPIQEPVLGDRQAEQEYAFLAQMMEQYARRRLQQQFDQQLHEINLKMDRQRDLLERERYRQRQQELEVQREAAEDYEANGNNLNQQYDQYDNAEAEASYGSTLDAVPNVQSPLYLPRLPNLPPLSPMGPNAPNRNSVLRERIPFAVGPNDARFFDNPNDPSGELDSRALEDYEEYSPVEPTPEVAKTKITLPVPAPVPVEPPKLLDAANANFHRIKPQSVAAAAVAGVNLPPGKEQSPHELNALINKLQKQSKVPAHLTLLNGPGDASQEQIVLRQHLGINSEMGVYIVALIAGVSAAVTVGLLALGVTWFHNRHKAAADVDYPAYGVTGPNKDVSPSGDRKLAQSAQMYHYQHQKQQIIAMENQATDGSCGMSDVESDDDNEEGDYTVYECPGLAPTGEMEVKNPLFLDETPATPANNLSAQSAAGAANAGATNNNITQATPQQPATQKGKGTVKPNMNLLNAVATAAAAAAATQSATTGGEEPKQKRKSKK